MFFTFQAGIVVIASYLDGTWHLPLPGKGLLDHYGVWAILVADPLAIISTAYAWYQFRDAMKDLPLKEQQRDTTISSLITYYLNIVKLNNRGILIYILFVLAGTLAWINNVVQTLAPEKYYHHKVFDSIEFILGFAATKLALFVSWVLIYPACGFVVLLLSLSTFLILQKLKSTNLLKPSALHPDGCYGFSALGRLNISLLIPFLIAFFVAFAILLTHEQLYASIVIPLITLTIIVLFVSVFTVYPILTQIREIRIAQYRELKSRAEQFSSFDISETLSFGIERICFTLSSGSPYSYSTKVLLIAFRAIPITVTAVKAIAPFV